MLYCFIYGRFEDDSACPKALGLVSKNMHQNVIETKKIVKATVRAFFLKYFLKFFDSS